jgi:hypothetical protein
MRFGMLILAALLAAHAAFAHDQVGSHGGRIADLGMFQGELVIKEKLVDLYVTDGAKQPVQVAGYKGIAILVADGKAERVVLEPAENNRLTGTSTVTLPAKSEGAVRLTASDGLIHQAKFD